MTLELAGLMAGLLWYKSRVPTRAGEGPGMYQYGKRVWWLEVAVYSVLVLTFYAKTVGVVIDLSERYKKIVVDRQRLQPHQSGLHESWLTGLTGQLLDIKDAQWHSFRDSLPLLAAFMLVYLTLSTLLRTASYRWPQANRVCLRVRYLAIVGLVALSVFHGADAIKVLFLATVNFGLCQGAGGLGKNFPAFVWALNIGFLYYNDVVHESRFASVMGNTEIAQAMDASHGMIKWNNIFNLVVLRMISFSMDSWWAMQAREKQAMDDLKEVPKMHPSPVWAHSTGTSNEIEVMESRLSERERVADYHPQSVYQDYVLYLAYLFYSPLYLAGPILSFNNFVSHLVVSQQTYTTRDKVRYGIFRFVLILLLFEVMNHYMYIGAIAYMSFRHSVAERDPTRPGRFVKTPLLVFLTQEDSMVGEAKTVDISQIVLYSYWSLMFLWFKFLLIWRFFRLWAVLDDVEPVENMERCMNNNYTISSFWRSWHRSFNRWLVRYVYIPLGGNDAGLARKVFNIAVVFSFVGFWHDVKLEMLAWAWLLSIFYIPELVATSVSRLPRVASYLDAHPIVASVILGVCGMGNIIMLKVANIIGYSMGLDYIGMLLPALQTYKAVKFLLEYSLFCIYAVYIMDFIRITRAIETKKAQGQEE